MTSGALEFLTDWFAIHCDGDWEHYEGIKIATLDNPGWALDVRIEDTELDGVVVDWHQTDDSEQSWIYWRSTGSMFEARCGPADLTRALDAFQEFVRTHQPGWPEGSGTGGPMSGQR